MKSENSLLIKICCVYKKNCREKEAKIIATSVYVSIFTNSSFYMGNQQNYSFLQPDAVELPLRTECQLMRLNMITRKEKRLQSLKACLGSWNCFYVLEKRKHGVLIGSKFFFFLKK